MLCQRLKRQKPVDKLKVHREPLALYREQLEETRHLFALKPNTLHLKHRVQPLHKLDAVRDKNTSYTLLTTQPLLLVKHHPTIKPTAMHPLLGRKTVLWAEEQLVPCVLMQPQLFWEVFVNTRRQRVVEVPKTASQPTQQPILPELDRKHKKNTDKTWMLLSKVLWSKRAVKLPKRTHKQKPGTVSL